ncbi:type I-E CRISPR-associated endonuclease Cas1e [Ferrovum sp.]|uniref:type I-E CRISPR-associated endonuclease Cas1e n=1 Tax=Ferrovum sp. TaxID=2609467 RepID=UPI002621CE68|nr:type I-E CRISPR-associated endonuclease Cas1e [Ferrovum sp.]
MENAALIPGRLGLAQAEIPYSDRHGLIMLSRGQLSVENGTLQFTCAKTDDLDAGVYAIPYQQVSMILLGPGSSVTHDALRILAHHGTQLCATGDGGVKCYTAPPLGHIEDGKSAMARKHAELWSVKKTRLDIARKMYAIRFGEILPHKDIDVLRGIEGGRIKEAYRVLAAKHRIAWSGRRYDRKSPESADTPNQAINHVSTFVENAANIAVTAVGALPQLGFIHETAGDAFSLDIADLYRVTVTVPVAFRVARKVMDRRDLVLERECRYESAIEFRKVQLIPSMIDAIKKVLNVDDGAGGT